MTKVDFYILQSDTEEKRLTFACRLLEKATRQGNKIFVQTKNAEMSAMLDEMLWDFKAEAYVPHRILNQEETLENDVPVLISHSAFSESHHDVLINLDEQLPQAFSHFKHYAQIVNQAPELLAASREHFAFLKKRGYPIEVNKLTH
jgi:DNA polymerase-3 subunit chi